MLAQGNGVPSPVLKHGPRTQTDAQGGGYRNTSLVLKGSPQGDGVHTQRMPNTHRPVRGLSASVPVWTLAGSRRSFPQDSWGFYDVLVLCGIVND